MIEVSLRLWTPQERSLFEQFYAEIEKLRAAEPAELVEVVGVVREHDATMPPPYNPPPLDPQLVVSPTQALMEDAVKAYGRAKGFPAARALLDEYTKGKIGDVPAEKRAELYARLTA